jgi:hypothetical protein
MRTKFATSAGLWKVPTRSVSTFIANSRERAFAYGRVVQIASYTSEMAVIWLARVGRRPTRGTG